MKNPSFPIGLLTGAFGFFVYRIIVDGVKGILLYAPFMLFMIIAAGLIYFFSKNKALR